MDWIRIDNLKGILDSFRPKIYHPDTVEYRKHWQLLRSDLVNGVWMPQFGKGYRYVPGRIGYFGVFGRFVDWTEDNRRIVTTPKVRDLEWHRCYYCLEADGFSGFSGDDKYTSDRRILNINLSKLKVSDTIAQHIFQSNGKLKEFIDPRENLFRLHDKPVGYPVYFNEARNHFEMGARGGGKSYWIAIGELAYDISLKGLKFYIPGDPKNADYSRTEVNLEVTSAIESKSRELLEKVEEQIKSQADPEFPELGVYDMGQRSIRGKKQRVVIPNPLWQRMVGNPKKTGHSWWHEIEMEINGRWEKIQKGINIHHTVYSPNQKFAAVKSAGGRRTRVIHEEMGLNEHFTQVLKHNEGLVSDNGRQKAQQKGIGTSGDVTLVQQAKHVFMNPRAYDALEFYSEEKDQNTCFFIPTHMVNMDFKNENGNTDIEAAKEFVKNKREKILRDSDPQSYQIHRMNFPESIDDMFIDDVHSLLPAIEAEERLKEISKGSLYKKLGTQIELYEDKQSEIGVNYRVDHTTMPYYEFPLEAKRTSYEASFMMYIHPGKLKINGLIPNDAIIVTHDPYVSDKHYKRMSLGVAHFIVNPKYLPYGLPGNFLAATLIGRPEAGTDEYNRILQLGCKFYGVESRNLWYEGTRGEKTRAYAIKKRVAHRLCLRPQYEQGQFVYSKSVTQTGYKAGSGLGTMTLVDGLHDWLLEDFEITVDGVEKKTKPIYELPCPFTLKQIMQYNLDSNFDAIDSLRAVSLAVGEMQFFKQKPKSANSNSIALYVKKRMRGYSRV